MILLMSKTNKNEMNVEKLTWDPKSDAISCMT